MHHRMIFITDIGEVIQGMSKMNTDIFVNEEVHLPLSFFQS